MSDPNATYNPLDYDNLTLNLVRELLTRGPYPVPPGKAFAGAGVYALFYNGDFEPYARLRSPAADVPIYVGKAIPAGGRKGQASGANAAGQSLFGRLIEHARSIDAATNLNLADFACRYLVVTPLWISMAERFLIENFQPIWNVYIEGFGIHDPGSGRHQGENSWWDSLHPGRPFAARLRQTRSQSDARKRLAEWYERQAKDPEAARRQAEEAAAEEPEEA